MTRKLRRESDHFDQLRLEVAADLLENGLEPLEGVSVKHFSSTFRDVD